MSYTNNMIPVLRIQSNEKLVMSNDFKYRQITDMQMVKYNQPFPIYNKEACAKLTSIVSCLMISGVSWQDKI